MAKTKKINKKKLLYDPVAEAKEAAKTTVRLVTASLTLVAGLAWNEVVKKFAEVYIQKWFKDLGEFIGLFVYALVLTIIVVIIINRLNKISSKIIEKAEDKSKDS